MRRLIRFALLFAVAAALVPDPALAGPKAVGDLCTRAQDCPNGVACTTINLSNGTSEKRCGKGAGDSCTSDLECATQKCRSNLASNPSSGRKCCGGYAPGAACGASDYNCDNCSCNSSGGNICCAAGQPECGGNVYTRACCASGVCCGVTASDTDHTGAATACLGTPRYCSSCAGGANGGDECPGPVGGYGKATCTNGVCGIQCDSGYFQCGNKCVTSDASNCGGCGLTCEAGLTCQTTPASNGGAAVAQCACTSTSCGTGKCCGKSSAAAAVNDTCFPNVSGSIGSYAYSLCPVCTVEPGCGTIGCQVEGEAMEWGGPHNHRLFPTYHRMEGPGALGVAFYFPAAGNYTVKVVARGELYAACDSSPSGAPHMRVLLADSSGSATATQLGETYVENTGFQAFTYTASVSSAGSRIVGIVFDNDCYNALGGDRNLLIDYVTVSASAASGTAGMISCNNACVDARTDPANCGACGNACAAGSLCTSGSCVTVACLQAIPGVVTRDIDLSATNTAACRLNATSVAQGVVDNQRGEDQSFFVQEATAPSLLVVIDNGVTMKRLPQDPACGVTTAGCNNTIIDLMFDKDSSDPGLNGEKVPDPDFNNLFDKDKYYQGAGDDVYMTTGCSSTSVNPSGKAAACSTALGASSTDLVACEQCLEDKGYYLMPNGKRIWSGRFLNVYPPKCVLARVLAKSPTLVGQNQVRYSVAFTKETTGTGTQVESALDFKLSGFWPNQCSRGPLGKVGIAPQYKNQINTHTDFDVVGKPLAEALYNAGEYLQDQSRFYGNFAPANKWTTGSGQGYETNSYAEGTNNNKVAVCSACQRSAIVMITDGKPCKDNVLPNTLATDPNNKLRKYTPLNDDGTCRTDSAGCKDWCDSTQANWAPAVAAMLNNEDLRVEDMAGVQTAQTYVIGLGTSNDLLRSTANRGGGEFFTAYTGSQLDEALRNIISTVSSRAVGVAAPSLSTLQTKSGSAALIPRFIPNKTPAWEGELYKFSVFSEFAVGCSADGKRDDNGTEVDDTRCVCHGGTCDGIYLLDKNDKFVGIDPIDGAMVEVAPRQPWVDGVPPLKSPRVLATPVWGAGAMLKSRAPGTRKLYTVLDTATSPGKLDSGDAKILIDATASDDTIRKFIPYLGLGSRGVLGEKGARTCDRIAKQLRSGGLVVNNFDEVKCARTILAWLQGYDAFNESNATLTAEQLATYSPTAMGGRPFKLGDIFHSSPVRVDAPVQKFPLCDRGFHNQCLRSLYASAVPFLTGDDAPTCGVPEDEKAKYDQYERYVYQQTHVAKRPSVVLVGANDGMLHAFQLACYKGKDAQTGQALYYEEAGHAAGCGDVPDNGTELWAFMPPDLLPKVTEMFLGRRHSYFVDGTAMVRDVWVDGSNSTAKDGKKACNEYRTVAVFGERRGGTHYTALDITDVQDPKFLWTFPQIGSPEELTMGESWSDYLPGAPPIGPVKLAKDTSWEERWVVMFGGGFDPRRVRGNQLYMVDVYSGQKLWEARRKAATSTEAMYHPFAAMPALVAWGSGANTANFDFNGGYFDTAIVGDVGGQVWLARFNEPGTIGTNPYGFAGDDQKVVTNWFVARAFEESKADGDVIRSRPPFFSLAAAVRMPTTGDLRAYVGSGDRYNLRQTDLGLCTLDNPLACAQAEVAEFKTRTDPEYRVGDDKLEVEWKIDSTGKFVPVKDTLTWAGDSACVDKAEPVQVDLAMGIKKCARTACTDLVSASEDPDNPAKDASYVCKTNSVDALLCEGDVANRGFADTGLTSTVVQGYADANPNYFSRFIAFQVFSSHKVNGTTVSRLPFTTAAAALTYDTNRLTESDLALMDPWDDPSPTATEANLGWYLVYPGLDERTATNTTIFNGCVLWSTVQASPPCLVDADCGTGGNCVAGGCWQGRNECAVGGSAVSSFLYQASAVSGGKTCPLTANLSRRTESKVVVPPPPPQEVVQVNTYGQFKTSIAPPPGGVAPSASPQTFSLMRYLYQTEVPQNVHECRHKSPATCK